MLIVMPWCSLVCLVSFQMSYLLPLDILYLTKEKRLIMTLNEVVRKNMIDCGIAVNMALSKVGRKSITTKLTPDGLDNYVFHL